MAGTHSATAADWTPYLKVMHECDYLTKSKSFWQAMGYSTTSQDGWHHPTAKPQKTKMPKTLQASVINLNHKESEKDSANVVRQTITLKNATAFGQPITKITHDSWEHESGEDSYTVTVYFANANFTNLKSQFPLTIKGRKYPIGTVAYYEIVMNDEHEPLNLRKSTKAQWDSTEVGVARTHQNGWSVKH